MRGHLEGALAVWVSSGSTYFHSSLLAPPRGAHRNISAQCDNIALSSLLLCRDPTVDSRVFPIAGLVVLFGAYLGFLSDLVVFFFVTPDMALWVCKLACLGPPG